MENYLTEQKLIFNKLIFALGIAEKILFLLKKKIETNSPTQRVTPKKN